MSQNAMPATEFARCQHFAQRIRKRNTEHESKVPRLPRKLTMEVSKVLRQKMQRIF